MKQILTLLLLTCSIGAFATRQQTDLLIIEKDTIHLKTFPLESLKLVTRPFGHTRRSAPSTSCWRGYRAVWRIKDNMLFLEKIIRCNYDREIADQNIKELFDQNGIQYKEKNGMVIATWLTMAFYKIPKQHFPDQFYLIETNNKKGDKKNKSFKLEIENGEVTLNRLKE